MSSIPNKAIPHAAPAAETGIEEGETLTLAQRVKDQAGRVASLARDNPRTAIAAGAAVAAGVAAAAAIPLVKARRGRAETAAKPAGKTPARGKTKGS
jgi:hypothetical protein